MFTGIVEELGEVVSVEPQRDAARLSISGRLVTSDARHGDSICVNGVCLTVAEAGGDVFTADVMRETLDRSAVRADQRLGGHIVQGHVDGTGALLSRERAEHWDVVRVSLPAALERYVAEKGSIAVDGVSLTVAGTGPGEFTVSLIPTTLKTTT